MTDFTDPPRLRLSEDSPIELVEALELARSEVPAERELASVASGLGALLSPDAPKELGARRDSVRAARRAGAASVAFSWKLLLAAIAAATGLGGLFHFVGEPKTESPPSAPPAEKSPAVPLGPALGAPAAADSALLPAPAEPGVVPSTTKRRAGPVASAVPTAMPAASSATPVGQAVFQDATSAMEASLLERARSALASDPGLSLRLTKEHVERFPAGVLGQERDFVAIEALVRLGKTSEAQDRAERFRKQYPGSAHLRRLDLLLPREAP